MLFVPLLLLNWRTGMPHISEVPVLIVGGGAVGCVLSMELARRGVEYRCIERMG